MDEIFHSGELKIQEITGEREGAKMNRGVISNTVFPGAVHFIEKQPLVVVSSKDDHGQVWASVLVGEPGLSSVPDTKTLLINLPHLRSTREDIFFENITRNPEVGTLFIEPATRRRYRINGRAGSIPDGIGIQVQEAYPNCPKYIQRRVVTFPETEKQKGLLITMGVSLGEDERKWIGSADTFFVGSSSEDGRMDVSHRGGNPGFIQFLEDGSLKIPDYSGNSLYNTLGNFHQNPNGGLTFLDYNSGACLQLTGRVTFLFDQQRPEDMERTTGTGRYWLFKIEKWQRIDNHHHATWEFSEYSPFNP